MGRLTESLIIKYQKNVHMCVLHGYYMSVFDIEVLKQQQNKNTISNENSTCFNAMY